MERQPQGGEHELHLVPPPEESHDERVIRDGIARAMREGAEVDDRTARYIVAQLHEGQASALYSLASTGAIAEDAHHELTRDYDQQTEQVKWWINWLGTYCLNREDKGAVPDWAASAAAIDRAEDEEHARQDLMERISAAGTTTLGTMATVIDSEPPIEATNHQDEEDTFPWVDAATWNPDEIARGEVDDRRYSDDELDAIFSETPDEEVGEVSELGWYGRIKHEDKPGGLILRQDQDGWRHVREALTDEALETEWSALRRDYESYYEERHAFELATSESDDAPSGVNPHIWVGSLADYNAGRLHGEWMDATLDPDELHAAIRFLLRHSSEAVAEEWAVFDYENFGGYRVEEYSSFDTIALIAKGIAEHGPAYAEWVDLVGDTSGELLEPGRFQDAYPGEYDSLEDYVEYILTETEFYGQLDQALEFLPEDLRRYVKVDTEGIAEEWGQSLHAVETTDGRVWVFEVRG